MILKHRDLFNLSFKKKIHFIGIAGVGMSALAQIFLQLGFEVSGSDLLSTRFSEFLKKKGAHIHQGHLISMIDNNLSCVVYSSAIDISSNVEYLEAQKKGIFLISRGKLLADLALLKNQVIAIAGSHGKTTTTTMLTSIFSQRKPLSSFILGGVWKTDSLLSAFWNKGDTLILETDEHDQSFLQIAPTVVLITNIDYEHVSTHRAYEALKKDFLSFMNKVPFYGFAVCSPEDLPIKNVLNKITVPFYSYSCESSSDLYAKNIDISENLAHPKIEYDLYNTNAQLAEIGFLGRVSLNLIGKHNVLNSLSAITVALGCGIDIDTCFKGINAFSGVERRGEVYSLGENRFLIEDYAHHPSAIQSILSSVSSKNRKRFVIFQPHLHSRLKIHLDGFARALMSVDEVMLLPVYRARESNPCDVSSSHLSDLMREKGYSTVEIFPNTVDLINHLQKKMGNQDVLFVLGAGDVVQLIPKIKNCFLSKVFG